MQINGNVSIPQQHISVLVDIGIENWEFNSIKI